jgi:hypothetical protein
LALFYVDAVINRDWPHMAKSEAPDQSGGITADMWKTVMSVRATSPTEQTAEDHALSELSSLNQHRLTRLLESRTRLPNVLWCVLLVGGARTIIAACRSGEGSVKLQSMQVFSFSLSSRYRWWQSPTSIAPFTA